MAEADHAGNAMLQQNLIRFVELFNIVMRLCDQQKITFGGGHALQFRDQQTNSLPRLTVNQHTDQLQRGSPQSTRVHIRLVVQPFTGFQNPPGGRLADLD